MRVFLVFATISSCIINQGNGFLSHDLMLSFSSLRQNICYDSCTKVAALLRRQILNRNRHRGSATTAPPLLESRSFIQKPSYHSNMAAFGTQATASDGAGLGRVGIAPEAAPRTVYVGNLPWVLPPLDIVRELTTVAAEFGRVEDIRVRRATDTERCLR